MQFAAPEVELEPSAPPVAHCRKEHKKNAEVDVQMMKKKKRVCKQKGKSRGLLERLTSHSNGII
eukprot:452859-Rhodomonas_salina.1